MSDSPVASQLHFDFRGIMNSLKGFCNPIVSDWPQWSIPKFNTQCKRVYRVCVLQKRYHIHTCQASLDSMANKKWLPQIVVISEEEGRRHRIAFNSLYLFSFRPINYEANREELYDSRVERPVSYLSLRKPLGFWRLSLCLCCSKASGRRGLHDTW